MKKCAIDVEMWKVAKNFVLTTFLIKRGVIPLSLNIHKNDFTVGRQSMLVFTIAFVVVGLMNATYLNMPPVWDAAAGVFAPAIYLYENDFDILSLLNEPGYLEAGPNVHSLGLITLLTCGIIKMTGGQPQIYLPVLHLFQIVLAAFVLTMTYGMARQIFGSTLAAAVTALLCLLPVFLVQTSYLYTEVAGSLFFLLWVKAWAARHYLRMIIFVMLACMVKDIGFVLVPVQVVLLVVDSSLTKRQRAGFIAVSVLTAVGAKTIEMSLNSATLFARPRPVGIKPVIDTLMQVPDLLGLVVVSMIFPFAYFVRWSVLAKNKFQDEMATITKGDYCNRLWLGVAIVPFMFVIFLVFVPLAGHDFFPLPRYYVWIMPFMILALAKTLLISSSWSFVRQSPAHNKVMFTLILFMAFSILNRSGKYYPSGSSKTSFSIAERSFEYVDYYRAQRAGVQAVAELSGKAPVIVTRGEYYFLSSPLMGYVDKRVEKLGFILSPRYKSGNISDFPEEFIVLDLNSNRYHGINIVKSVIEQASNSKCNSIDKLTNYKFGRYESVVLRIKNNKIK